MQIHFKNIHEAVPKRLINRTERQVLKLDKMLHEGTFESSAEIEITKAAGARHSERAWRASINLDSNGDRYHTESTNETPALATRKVIDELKTELRRSHERARDVRRRSRSIFKSLGEFA
jgi:ribosome-associated translation inhibitor RaiA